MNAVISLSLLYIYIYIYIWMLSSPSPSYMYIYIYIYECCSSPSPSYIYIYICCHLPLPLIYIYIYMNAVIFLSLLYIYIYIYIGGGDVCCTINKIHRLVEFKVSKALLEMLRISQDPLLKKNAQPFVITGRKWNVKNTLKDAISSLKTKKVVSANCSTSKANTGFHPQRLRSNELSRNTQSQSAGAIEYTGFISAEE